MEDILWSLDPANDSMERSLLRMREYTDSLETHYTASIEFHVDKNVTAINLDMKKRLEFLILFKESLKAIVQYAHGRQTHITLSLSGNKLLQLNIQDTTAHTDTSSPELEKLIKELYNRSAYINAEADIQRDHKGMAIILLVPMA
jgi:glucose-6-phosphate-specific signal transduction histidine kinase